ncbi:DUF2087 domain-containing protein [Paenibacillus darwinianus]|uniref:DUF2087 domain-containing protein n=1 Tax=Paenibacillus darwinianus TaxID=1380763 RepID=UPI0009DC9817|nr:DUF2087 domain-containing protein [Paenibacillus darwinianus]
MTKDNGRRRFNGRFPIAASFKLRRRYTEKEVNELLKRVYAKDYVTLRRYLIEYGGRAPVMGIMDKRR